MDLSLIKDLIAGVGFPVFVAIYLLMVMTKHVKANTQAITELKDLIAKICTKIGA